MSSNEPEDVALIVAIARGSQQALGSLYDRHASSLLALGMRILQHRLEAEDILHDVFLEVWKRAGDYDPRRGTVRTWLIVRMRSRCLDRLRSPRCLSDVSAHLEELPPESPSKISRASDALRLIAAVSELSDKQRQVLVMGFFEGLSFPEIADKLELPVGTVKSRAARAISALRGSLTPEPSPEAEA